MASKLTKRDRTKIQHQCWCPNTNKNQSKQEKIDYEIYSTSQNTFDSIDEEESNFFETVKTEKKNEKEKENEEPKLYPFKFEWRGAGFSVLITGSFLENWKKFEHLEKNGKTGIFEKILHLPKTKHYFKFVVDNKWYCNTQYEIIKDSSNNKNNVIDLTNYIPPQDLIKKEEIKKEKEKEKKTQKNKVMVFGKKNDYIFNCRYKSSFLKELNIVPPSASETMQKCFKMDYMSNQNKIKKITKKRFLKYKDKNKLTENDTYKKILPCPHDKLMHFCTNINNIKNEYKSYIKACATVRNKHKNLTVVYYKPKQNEDYYY